MAALPGTALPVVAAATGTGAFAASFSLLHSMYRSVATASQAKRRKTRVWFMRGARARVVAALRFEKRSARKFKGMGAMRPADKRRALCRRPVRAATRRRDATMTKTPHAGQRHHRCGP